MIFKRATKAPIAIVNEPKIKSHDQASSNLGSFIFSTVNNMNPPKNKNANKKPKIQKNFRIKLTQPTGFEPAIFSVTGRRVRPGYTTAA